MPVLLQPRVALLIESTRAYGRELLSGVAAFLKVHGPWSVFHQERGLGDATPGWLRNWTGDGVIGRFETRDLVRLVRRRGIPAVDLRGRFDIPGTPLIETDDRAVVRLAVQHLAGRGLTQFAFCGFSGANYSERRLAYFREFLGAATPVPVFESPPPQTAADTVLLESMGLSQEDALARWLRQLPRPVGVFACNDIRAQQVLNTCRARGVAVPDDVSVIGVDNDEILCNLSYPSLSSVQPDARGIGYQAARLLEKMMHGEQVSAATVFVPPCGVVARGSTDGLAIPDRHVVAAVRFIRDHACRGIDVPDVLAQVPLSRSTLERRFQRHLGCSPKEEIIRVRIGRVKQLLAETDYTLAAVARRTGFNSVEHLSALFAQRVGQPPGQYRRFARARHAAAGSEPTGGTALTPECLPAAD
jgi:LacI family transcriptional regulator